MKYPKAEILYSGTNSVIYATSDADKKLIMKILKQDVPSFENASQLHTEYQNTHALEVQGVRRAVAMTTDEGRPALVLEYFDGLPLKDLIDTNISVERFLDMAIKLTDILGKIHQHKVIHKDINPNNILYKPDTNELQFIDFGISSRLSQEFKQNPITNHFEGTVAYVSPEQTGRMNRSIDYRSDFYSLGVTFYELLTGRLPFESEDSMEIVHAHIAKQPTPPHHIRPDIPKIISEVVLKLMEKNAENRYQSAWGLRTDLDKIRTLLMTRNGKINDVTFVLGEKDFVPSLRIPQKLYGREQEVAKLLEAFERVSVGSCEVLQVAGFSGVGKSSLVREVHKPMTEKRGIFIEGKYDQLQRNVPFLAIRNAFKEFANYLLIQDTKTLEAWRNKIKKAVGINLNVLLDFIPELSLITGDAGDVAEIGFAEAQNRFYHVFGNFIKNIASVEHPLVLFIDDMQWADLNSLALIKSIVSDNEMGCLLIIMSYRENEVNASHPLTQLIQDINQTNVPVEKILLRELSESDVQRLICDTLDCNPYYATTLIEHTFSKTKGNPFFIKHFLQSLFEKELLVPTGNMRSGQNWTWEIEKIKLANISENVIDLMTAKIETLSEQTRQLLTFASCIGNRFSLEALSAVAQRSSAEVSATLWHALDEGLLLPANDDYKLNGTGVTLDRKIDAQYVFVHDRVQQAVYSLIPLAEKQKLHFHIAKLLYAQLKGEELENKIFELADQWMQSVDLAISAGETNNFADISLLAGKKALSSGAYPIAFRYLQAAINVLPPQTWQSNYQLMLELHEKCAEAAFLSGDISYMDKCIVAIKEKALTSTDKARAYEIKMLALSAENKGFDAIDEGREILGLLGINIPVIITKLTVIASLIKIQLKLRGVTEQDIFNLPPMTDVSKLYAMRILNNLASPALKYMPTLYPITIFRRIEISLRYGNSDISSIGYSGYAMLLSNLLKKYKKANTIADLAIALMEKHKNRQIYTRNMYALGYNVRVYKKPFKELLDDFIQAYRNGLESGDIEYGGYSAFAYGYVALSSNKLLHDLFKEYQPICELAKKYNNQAHTVSSALVTQVIHNLISNPDDIAKVSGEYFNPDEILPLLKERKDALTQTAYDMLRCFVAYLMGDYRTAFEAFKQPKGTVYGYNASIEAFLGSLCYSALYSTFDEKGKKEAVKYMKRSIKSFEKWTIEAPHNYEHRCYLLRAELARIQSNYLLAKEQYDKAIHAAAKNEFLSDEGIAWELAARFMMEQKHEPTARVYIQQSFSVFKLWGANAKVKQMETMYKQYLVSFERIKGKHQTSTGHSTSTGTRLTSGSTATGNFLDVGTIVKASQTLAGEIVLSNLLQKMMDIVLENAGAEKGIIVQPIKEDLYVQASKKAGQNIELTAHKIEKAIELPLSIINYVLRTKSTVVLDDAAHDKKYGGDAYIHALRPKSVLCFPVVRTDQVKIIFYLENNLATGAFTPQRLEVLQTLSAQMSISMENASLYENLEEKVRERTSQLQSANEEITRQKEEIEETHHQITQSINYARRIQEAILPDRDDIAAMLPDHFVIFEPRDVVSGDFYWFKKIGSRIYALAADCTGHGVPGAFMSMLGLTFINEIVTYHPTATASYVLDELREHVKVALRQTGRTGEQQDGMDIAFTIIDNNTGELQFAGAHNPLYVIRNIQNDVHSENSIKNETHELIQLNPDRQPIGIYRKEKPFTNHQLKISVGDKLYMFSDGIIDQMGGERGTKFMSINFKHLLIQHHHKNMTDQKQTIEEAVANWRQHGVYRQVDDMLVIGMQV